MAYEMSSGTGGNLIFPAVYYTTEGEKIVAKDANGDICPSDIEAQINKIVEDLKNDLEHVRKSVENIEESACRAVVVQNTTIRPVIEDALQAIDSTPTKINGKFRNLYKEAVSKHNELQKKYNEEAKNEKDRKNEKIKNAKEQNKER